MALTDSYLKLLILQYADKPKASAEIKAIASEFENIYDFMAAFETAFDLDNAIGVQLDVIGKIIGLNRTVPLVIPKNFFGFSDNPNMFGFDDKFGSAVAYPFKDKNEPSYTDTQLSDTDYRFFMRAKIAKNTCVATMSGYEGNAINNVINYLFNGAAFVEDNKDMSLTIYVDDDYDVNKIEYIKQLDLLPKPQGVYYRDIVVIDDAGFFGFADNPASLGFGDGVLAYKLI